MQMYPYEYSVSLRLNHPTRDLSEIYNKLSSVQGLIPGRIWSVGDGRLTILGKKLEGQYKESYCFLDTSDEIQNSGDCSLPDALERVLEDTKGLKNDFLEHVKSGGELEFFIGVYVNANNDISFSPSLMGQLAELNIEIGLDLYPPDIEEKELNERQMKMLKYTQVNSEKFITMLSYQKINKISGPTAAKDLKELIARHFIVREKTGRQVKYYLTYKSKTFFKK
ncbi:hypothetical protein N8083_01345 [Candidatus Pacebacteria bacterium]|nr:hypothetical protein [Candidatus Paceibacterota bacterium]